MPNPLAARADGVNDIGGQRCRHAFLTKTITFSAGIDLKVDGAPAGGRDCLLPSRRVRIECLYPFGNLGFFACTHQTDTGMALARSQKDWLHENIGKVTLAFTIKDRGHMLV